MRNSTRTLRFQGVGDTRTIDEMRGEAEGYLKKKCRPKRSFFRSKRASSDHFETGGVLEVSLAQQNEFQTATITYSSDSHKEVAFKNARKALDKVRHSLDLDDTFRGITVLYSGSNTQRTDIDICAIHGLDGHAFDTWMADTNMWLRDILPRHSYFQSSRIMTYGYNSTLFDKRNMDSRLSDFSDSLLLSLGGFRITPEERSRPVLFICHSMGGILARLAMTRHNRYPKKFPGVSLGPCGLLFLSTPNAGSMAAEWPKLVLALTGTLVGVRANLVNELQVLNPKHVDSIDDWNAIRNPPLVRCFCESSNTGSRRVVTIASASFREETATILPETDHHTVCKFERNTSEGFLIVIGCLCQMKEELLSRCAHIALAPVNMYKIGAPNISAPSYPLAKPRVFDNGFRKLRHNFVNRTKLLEEAAEIMHRVDANEGLVLTGMAGSGKTELLLKIAGEQGAHRNVFFLSALDYPRMKQKLEEYACLIGHDVLRRRVPYPEQHIRWAALPPEIQRQFFLDWAADIQNNCLIIIDELDSGADVDLILNDLPQSVRIAVSTRNPELIQTLSKRAKFSLVSVVELEVDEAKSLIMSLNASKGFIISLDQAERLAIALDRHPFAICAASEYLPRLRRVLDPSNQESTIEVFIDILEGSDQDERKAFYDFDNQPGLSITELFKSVLVHTGVTRTSPLLPLLRACAFISVPGHAHDLAQFFHAVKPSTNQERSEGYQVDDVFRKGLRKEWAMLDKAIKSSLIIETTPGCMYMPLMWQECIIMHTCDQAKKRYWLNQILELCYLGDTRDDSKHDLGSYVENCIRIATRYNIHWQSLLADPAQRDWLENTIDGCANDAFANLLEDCQAAEEFHRTNPSTISEINVTYAKLTKRFKGIEREYCNGAMKPESHELRLRVEGILVRGVEAVGIPI